MCYMELEGLVRLKNNCLHFTSLPFTSPARLIPASAPGSTQGSPYLMVSRMGSLVADGEEKGHNRADYCHIGDLGTKKRSLEVSITPMNDTSPNKLSYSINRLLGCFPWIRHHTLRRIRNLLCLLLHNLPSRLACLFPIVQIDSRHLCHAHAPKEEVDGSQSVITYQRQFQSIVISWQSA